MCLHNKLDYYYYFISKYYFIKNKSIFYQKQNYNIMPLSNKNIYSSDTFYYILVNKCINY